MKKYLLFSVAALLFASCSSNSDENTDNSDVLTAVSIGATTGLGDNTTRAIWGSVSDGSVGVKFNSSDNFDVYEQGHSGYHTFTCTETTPTQSAGFDGLWHANGINWAAVLPSGAANSVSFGSTKTTFNVKVPSSQTCFFNSSDNVNKICPDRSANVMIASRNTHADASCFLAPVCTYLMFTTNSSIKSVTLKSKNTYMAGNLVVVAANNWTTSPNFADAEIASFSVGGQGGSKEIKVTGAVDGSETKYVVCLCPGTYAAGDLEIYNGTALIKSNSNPQTFKAINVYDLGKID